MPSFRGRMGCTLLALLLAEREAEAHHGDAQMIRAGATSFSLPAIGVIGTLPVLLLLVRRCRDRPGDAGGAGLAAVTGHRSARIAGVGMDLMFEMHCGALGWYSRTTTVMPLGWEDGVGSAAMIGPSLSASLARLRLGVGTGLTAVHASTIAFPEGAYRGDAGAGLFVRTSLVAFYAGSVAQDVSATALGLAGVPDGAGTALLQIDSRLYLTFGRRALGLAIGYSFWRELTTGGFGWPTHSLSLGVGGAQAAR